VETYVERRENIIAVGNSGTGKTDIALGLGLAACQKGLSVGRQEYGGLKSDQVKRLKELETENVRLRKAVSDLTLEKLILKEAASGNW
jgi:DNA replication protein DnaC